MTLDTLQDYIEQNLVHSLHTSERMSRRGCRRRWDWIFHDMYYPRITAKPLEFGVAFHKALEVYYDPMNRIEEDWETPAALARVAFVQVTAAQKAKFVKFNYEEYTSEVDTDYNERVELGLGMLDFFCKKVAPELDEDLRTVKVELPFEVVIRHPDTGDYLYCKCNQCYQRMDSYLKSQNEWDSCDRSSWTGLPVTYGGRLDRLSTDIHGNYWIDDWKTSSRMTNAGGNADDDFMLLDDQITSYCWALWTLGINVSGFNYIEIKKAYPKPPEPNKTQRLGRYYSVNKQQNTTYELYKATVEEYDPAAFEAGLYDDFLDYLKENATTDHYAHRSRIVRSEEELINAGRNIWAEAKEMIDRSMVNYPSPGRFACNFCAFRDPCIAKNRGEDFEDMLNMVYDKRTKHYWETAESTTDKRYG